MKLPKSVWADLALLFITLLWASTFAVVKECLVQASPVLFLALRFWIAGAAILLFLPGALRGISQKTLWRGCKLSLLLATGYVFQTVGLKETTPSRCAFITSLFVLLVPLFGYVLIRYRPRIQTLFGIGLATAGLVFLTLNPKDLTVSRGDVLTLLCAVVFALQILFLGRYLNESDHRQLTVLQILGTAVLCTLVGPVIERPFISWNAGLTLYLIMTGVFATALTCYIQSSAQRFTTANRAALVFALEPFFACLFAYVLLGQTMTGREWLGGGLVLAGIITSELRRNGKNSAWHNSLAGATARSPVSQVGSVASSFAGNSTHRRGSLLRHFTAFL